MKLRYKAEFYDGTTEDIIVSPMAIIGWERPCASRYRLNRSATLSKESGNSISSVRPEDLK